MPTYDFHVSTHVMTDSCQFLTAVGYMQKMNDCYAYKIMIQYKSVIRVILKKTNSSVGMYDVHLMSLFETKIFR